MEYEIIEGVIHKVTIPGRVSDDGWHYSPPDYEELTLKELIIFRDELTKKINKQIH